MSLLRPQHLLALLLKTSPIGRTPSASRHGFAQQRDLMTNLMASILRLRLTASPYGFTSKRPLVILVGALLIWWFRQIWSKALVICLQQAPHGQERVGSFGRDRANMWYGMRCPPFGRCSCQNLCTPAEANPCYFMSSLKRFHVVFRPSILFGRELGHFFFFSLNSGFGSRFSCSCGLLLFGPS